MECTKLTRAHTPSFYDRREVIQSYGYEYLFTLANLESAGLLYRRPELGMGFGSSSSSSSSASSDGGGGAGGGNWAAVRKALRLVKENVRTLNPDDIAYVSSGAFLKQKRAMSCVASYHAWVPVSAPCIPIPHPPTPTPTGYAPLTARLLQLAHKPGWGSANCADVLRQLPGPALEFTQGHPAAPHSFLPVLQELDRLLAPPAALSSSAATGTGGSSAGAGAGAAAGGGSAGAGGGGGGGSGSGGIRTASPLPSGLFSVGSSASSTASSLIGGMSSLGLSSGVAKAPASSQQPLQQQQPAPSSAAAAAGGKTLPNGRKVMLAYFVGGVSFMEIAALRQLSRQPDFPFQIVVCTTKLINGNTLVQSLQEDIRNGLLAGGEAGVAAGSAGPATSYWTPR